MNTRLLCRQLPVSGLIAALICLLALAAPVARSVSESGSDQELSALPANAAPVEKTPAPTEEPAPQPVPAAEGTFGVSGAVPLPSEKLTDRILIFFDEPLDTESLPTPPAEVQPEATGRWRVGAQFLELPWNSLPTEKVVTVTLSPELRSKSGKALAEDQRIHVFARTVFEPVRLFLREAGEEGAEMGVDFSMPFNAESLRTHLSAEGRDGGALFYDINPSDDDKICLLKFHHVDPWPLVVRVTAGLEDASGHFTTSKNYALDYPSHAELDVKEVTWNRFEPHEQEIALRFSKKVDAAALEAHLRIWDLALDRRIPFLMLKEGEQGTHIVKVRLENQERVWVSIRLDEELHDTQNVTLKEPYETTLERRATPLLLETKAFSSRLDGPVLTLGFNQAVSVSELQKHVKATPEAGNLRVSLVDTDRYHYRWDKGRFRYNLDGDWLPEAKYTITIGRELEYAPGLRLGKDVNVTLTSSPMSQHLAFSDPGRFYLPLRAGASLTIEARKHRNAHLQVYRLFPNNIALAFGGIVRENRHDTSPQRWGESVGEADIPLEYSDTEITKTPVDVRGIIQSQRGVFAFSINGGRQRLGVWTNLGLLAHWQKEQLVLFVHDLMTLEPREHAHVTVYTDKNQVLAEGNTDARGLLWLSPFNPSLGRPVVAVVEYKDDYTFLELDRRDADPVGYTSSMMPYDAEAQDAFIYADRDLYRPGETIHLRWLVRTGNGEAAPGMPLRLRVKKPNRGYLLDHPVRLSDLGTGDKDIITKKEYPTGEYTAELFMPGNYQNPIGSYTFHIEEFVPNRLEASIETGDEPIISGRKREVVVCARHLVGGAAADRKVDLTAVLHREAWNPKGWEGFRFGNDSRLRLDPADFGELRTDEEGRAAFTVQHAVPGDFTFPAKMTFVGRVFELGGRPVNAIAECAMLPSDTTLGIAAEQSPEGGLDVAVAAVRADGSPAELGSVQVTVELRRWSYYLRRYYSHDEPNWSQWYTEVETREVALVDGCGSFKLDIPAHHYGQYRLRVHSDATPQYSTKAFGYYHGHYWMADPSRPSLIDVSLDKERYAVGDIATVRVESPFDGKCVLALQGERLLDVLVVDIKDGLGQAQIEVKDEHFPNAWIEATAVHAVEPDSPQVYAYASFAMVSLSVDQPKRRLDVAFVELPEEVKPAQDVTFTVTTKDGGGQPVQAELTLAIVDEGIHQITGYESPDPYAWVARPRRPDYNRAHYYDRVAYDFERVVPGGGKTPLAKRTLARNDNWIEPVALWSGTAMSDENGVFKTTVTLPEFSGQLRLVVVAAGKEAVGSLSEKLLVRRKYTLRANLPRFTLPRDRFHAGAIVINHGKEPVTARVSWSVSGALRGGEGSQNVPVPAQGETLVPAEIDAGSAIGPGAVRWVAAILDATGAEVERLEQELALPVRAPAAYQSDHELVTLQPGESRTFRNTRFLDDDLSELALHVSGNPLTRLGPALSYLVGYPYGCVEQTTSRLFPMYLLRKNADLLAAARPEGQGETEDRVLQKAQEYTKAGIDRLFAFQTGSGGLAVWAGHERPYPYGSVYALHLLTLLKKDKQWDLPAGNLVELQNYVRRIAYTPDDKGSDSLYTRAYAIYVLALDGELRAIEQIGRFDDKTLPTAARYLLAAALAMHTEDNPRVAMYLDTAPQIPVKERRPSGSLSSPIRNQAVQLYALNQVQGREKEAAELAGHLEAFITGKRHGNTQETAFVIAALAGYMDKIARDIEGAKVDVTDARAVVHQVTGAARYAGRHQGKGGSFTVDNSGPVPMYVSFTSRGVPANPDLNPVREGIAIARKLYTSDGEPLDAGGGLSLSQTRSYVMGIELQVDLPRVENLVVVDKLAAGLEIENPRLSVDLPQAVPLKSTVSPSHVDLRDDRLVLAFNSIGAGTYHFYYVVRAITPGTYAHPPIEAECMYDARIRGASAPGEVRVVRE
jgi:alpha-2-macroglobulin